MQVLLALEFILVVLIVAALGLLSVLKDLLGGCTCESNADRESCRSRRD
jgi:hypothetical protein